MFGPVMLAAVSGLALCSVCLTIAKRSAPVSRNDAKVLWVVHKQNDLCMAHRWKLKRLGRNKIVGFKCECGYQYTHKRPLLSRMPRID